MATRQRTVCLSGGDRAERFTDGKSFQVPWSAALCSRRIAMCVLDRCGSLYSGSFHAHKPAAEGERCFQRPAGAQPHDLCKAVIAPFFPVLFGARSYARYNRQLPEGTRSS